MASNIYIECYKCKACGNVTLEKKIICPKCGGSEIASELSEGKGTVVDSTIVYFPPDNYKDIAPYTSVLVELDSGCRLFGIIGGEHRNLAPGNPVVAVSTDNERGGIFFGPPPKSDKG